ncbi:MAG: hypothetical protein HQM10_15360 [Candidatus Riflebacteria bacterium]|nr:hypothetical protein [Candidatus Riflebacteria bacterium]
MNYRRHLVLLAIVLFCQVGIPSSAQDKPFIFTIDMQRVIDEYVKIPGLLDKSLGKVDFAAIKKATPKMPEPPKLDVDAPPSELPNDSAPDAPGKPNPTMMKMMEMQNSLVSEAEENIRQAVEQVGKKNSAQLIINTSEKSSIRQAVMQMVMMKSAKISGMPIPPMPGSEGAGALQGGMASMMNLGTDFTSERILFSNDLTNEVIECLKTLKKN